MEIKLTKFRNRISFISIFFIFFIFLFSFSLVSAAPPITTVQQLNTGLQISYPSPYYLIYNHSLSIRFWVYNLSNGVVLTNITTNCTYNLLEHSGRNVYRNGTIQFGGLPTNACQNCYNLELPNTLFNYTGVMMYQIRCQSNSMNEGGFLNGLYEITVGGFDEPSWSIQPIILIILIVLLFFVIGIYSENKFIISLTSFMFVFVGLYTLLNRINQISIEVSNIIGISCILIGCYSLLSIAFEYFELFD